MEGGREREIARDGVVEAKGLPLGFRVVRFV